MSASAMKVKRKKNSIVAKLEARPLVCCCCIPGESVEKVWGRSIVRRVLLSVTPRIESTSFHMLSAAFSPAASTPPVTPRWAVRSSSEAGQSAPFPTCLIEMHNDFRICDQYRRHAMRETFNDDVDGA